METLTSRKFIKDSDRLSSQMQTEIAKLILHIKNADNLDAVDLKKMSGFKDYYRIRLGNYRVGIRIAADTVFFERVAKRDEIYKIFP